MIARMRRDRGLTLIETMVAILIFSMVTLGITPVIISSIRGSANGRSYTIGKNLVLQSTERIRGLPYFESVMGTVSPTRRDVLDLYFPNRSTGYSAGTFTTVCSKTTQTPAASAPAACPPDFENVPSSTGSSAIPDDFTLRFEAQFVRPGTTTGGQQSFTVVTPPTNYNWATLATEDPPAQLVRIVASATWTLGGAAKTFTTTSLVGERTLSPDQIRADAKVDFAVQGSTSYLADNGRVSTLTAVGGKSSSGIETRSVSSADEDTRAARLTLVENDAVDGSPGSVLQDLFGAGTALHAPPDTFLAPNVTGTSQTATFQPNASTTPVGIAFAGSTSVTNAGAKVVNELPVAQGTYGFTGVDLAFWIDNQASTGSRTDLLLHGTRNMLTVRRDVLGITGSTKTEATAISPTASRKVESTATINVGRVDLFPTTYISQEQRAVVVIRDFTMSMACKSTASASTAGVTGTWSAKFKYWRDTTQDGNDNGSYSPEVTIGGSVSGGTEVLEAIQTANPLVYDHIDNTRDVYLFAVTGKKGYLQDWSMQPQITWSEDAAGRTTMAAIEGALQMITSPTNPAIADSALNITLGKLSCLAVDKR